MASIRLDQTGEMASIRLDHIRSPAKSHQLLATISTQSQSSGSNASWSADLMANENCANFLQPAGLGLPPIKQQTAGGESQWQPVSGL